MIEFCVQIHWLMPMHHISKVFMSRAYNMETPFISPSVMTMIEEQREENVVFEEVR